MTIEVNSIAGLFNELYRPVDLSKIRSNGDSEYFFKNWNSIFWNKLLSEETVYELLEIMKANDINSMSVWEKAVMNNEDAFVYNLMNAINVICTYNESQQEMFSCLETVQLYCNLVSKYLFYPYLVNVQEGIIDDSNSFEKLLVAVKQSSFCKDFLLKMIMPYLKSFDFIWVNGQLKYSTLLAIMCLRKYNPNVFVAIRYHESEYFSYNKIEEYLKSNAALFNYIDCIVLDNNRQTMEQVELNYNDNKKLKQIENILYKNKDDGKVYKTKSCKVKYSIEDFIGMPYEPEEKHRINVSLVVNMRIYANKSCYWHKCAFCGINKKYKYQYLDESSDLSETIMQICKFYEIGYKYFWFEDEAIKKDNLLEFALEIIKKNLEIFWQVRTRFDAIYSREECRLLYQAGLREIRFGYESGDKSVLKKMNKYTDDFDYEIIENNISIFSQSGIHVHLPVILGFPTETNDQKEYTISKLKKYKKLYDITFNLNRFLLDVSSDAFRSFYMYNIYELHLPTKYDDFLGNFALYNNSDNVNILDNERNEIMREVLYPWMPKTSLLSSIIFYRLTESSRMTLIWAQNKGDEHLKKLKYKFNTNTSIIEEGKDIIIYVWDNHYIIKYERDIFEKIRKMDLEGLPDRIVQESIEKKIII